MSFANSFKAFSHPVRREILNLLSKQVDYLQEKLPINLS